MISGKDVRHNTSTILGDLDTNVNEFDYEREGGKERNSKKEELVKEARILVAALLDAVEDDKKNATKAESPLAFSKMSLKAFAASNMVSFEKFKNSGGLKSILIAVRNHCGSSSVVEHGCKALTVLTLYDSSIVKELVRGGVVESIVTAINSQTDDGTDDSCVATLKVLRNLTQAEDNRLLIWNASGVEAVIKMMEANSQNPRTLSHGSLVLSNLAFGNGEIKEAVGRCGGLAAIAKAMLEFQDNQAVQARGSLALRNLCYQCEKNQKVAAECDATTALLAAIELYIEDREVVHQSCVALANLSSVNEINRTKIVDAHGAGIIVKLMKKYPKSLTVQDDCLSIIRNVAVGSPDAQLELGLNGGIASVCLAMDAFNKNEKIMDKACSALRYLCFLADNRVRVRESKGIEAICATFGGTGTSAAAVKNALLALGNATFESLENKDIVGRCGGIGQIVNVIQQHRLDADIQEHGCRVLRNLADGFEFNRLLEVECGGIAAAVFAMIGFPDNASVQEQACAMLLNMSLSNINLEKLEQADVRRLAEKAISLHSKHRGVQLQAGTLLDRMNGFDVGSGAEDTNRSTGDDNEHAAPKRGFSIFRFQSRKQPSQSR